MVKYGIYDSTMEYEGISNRMFSSPAEALEYLVKRFPNAAQSFVITVEETGDQVVAWDLFRRTVLGDMSEYTPQAEGWVDTLDLCNAMYGLRTAVALFVAGLSESEFGERLQEVIDTAQVCLSHGPSEKASALAVKLIEDRQPSELKCTHTPSV